MKKLALSIIMTFALFSLAAFAQTGPDPSQVSPGASPSTSQPATPSQQEPMPGQQKPGQMQPDPTVAPAPQPTSDDTTPADKADKKLRGCIQSQAGQYVLETKKGNAVALAGQDVSAHVGHEVELKGTWENASAGNGDPTASSNTSKTFNVASVEMISDTCSTKSSNPPQQ